MNVSDWNIDELVANVMSDLRASTSASDSAASVVSRALTRDFQAARSSTVPVPESDGSSSDDGAFYVNERALVVETVRRLASTTLSKRWIVPSKTLITPAARDELKKFGIEIVARGGAVERANDGARDSALSAARTTRPSALLINHAPNDEQPSRTLVEYLSRNAELKERRFSCLKETTRFISEEIATAPELKVVLTTSEPAIALIWANRYRGVRAIGAWTAEQAARDISATNANVVVVNPRELGSYQLRRVVDSFVRFERKKVK